ncbi:MAG TPA: pantoate--beta-alanine ligase [Niastella sp.]|nr:pantoate--beta-alanine ligase [Niastella sp.]
MILFKKAMALSMHLDNARKKNQTIGFVPTMGALHQGHLALIEACKKEADICVCSIFVNPAQFNNPTDFKLYPSTIDKDIEVLLKGGCDALFLPAREEMYPPGFKAKQYDLGYLEALWEGQFRPGHFQGVCQAVDRLLGIVEPTSLYMGQKDYQQCLVIKKLLALTDREAVSLKIIPTIREESGLAMSSRNLRLTEEQRSKAVALYSTLGFLKSSLPVKSITGLEKEGAALLQRSGFNVDYVAIADADNLQPALEVNNKKLVALIAATIGDVRLIDNMPLN